MWDIDKQNNNMPKQKGIGRRSIKKKFNKEHTKKQLTMLCLVAALFGAVYLNYRIDAGNKTLTITEDILESSADTSLEFSWESAETSGDTIETDTEPQEGKNYGDTLFVSAPADNSSEYFVKARLDRTLKRDEALDNIEQALKAASLTEKEKQRLISELSAITGSITEETKIENAVIAKGFSDCVVFLQNDSVKVTVKCAEGTLDAEKAAQIKEAVISQTGIGADKIYITEVE